MEFFTTSTRNLLEAAMAPVTHYVALSVVGTDRIPDSPYLRADAQEMLIKAAGVPYSIVQRRSSSSSSTASPTRPLSEHGSAAAGAITSPWRLTTWRRRSAGSPSARQ